MNNIPENSIKVLCFKVQPQTLLRQCIARLSKLFVKKMNKVFLDVH